MLLGSLLARIENIGPRWLERELRHSIIAFGGGVLLSAVALVLIPEGIEYLPSATVATIAFLSGGLTFFAIERFLGLQGREAPQFSAMLLDYVPEALALGGMFSLGSSNAPLLAVLIGLQSLPEGFNAYRELTAKKDSYGSNQVFLLILMMIPLGPLAGYLGWTYGAKYPEIIGGIMVFAGGGIMYLLFQDIAPQSHLKRHWAPALGAVLGFSVGMFGRFMQ
jgi:ZIP family zinc transporter